MYRFLQLLVLLSVIVGCFFLYTHFKEYSTVEPSENALPVVLFNEKTPLRVYVADDAAERKQGLSSTGSLPLTKGMLFVFDEEGRHGMWMKDMQYPIDIIWINAVGRIVDIRKNATPESYPENIVPKEAARFVIEANAYFTESFGIAVGDVVTLPESVLPADLRSR